MTPIDGGVIAAPRSGTCRSGRLAASLVIIRTASSAAGPVGLQITVRSAVAAGSTVNGAPLRFWHFTKLGPLGDTMTRRYAGANFPVYEIWSWYKRQVTAVTDPTIPERYWAFAAYEDGRPIAKAERVLYRERTDLQQAFPNPFASGRGSFQEWLEHEGA